MGEDSEMSQPQDDARAARIQKYKEERRKQLTARTATLFSANVTERRPRRTADQSSEYPAGHLKSSSELNLAAASTSVPIRTTRTSRLRAAAAIHSDSAPSLRKSNRSSSAQSLEDVKTKKNKNAKIIERDKGKTNINRKQSHEKENLKSTSSTCFPDKEIGAIRSKPKHSINKNILEKDKSNVLASSLKGKHNVDEKLDSKLDDKRKTNSSIQGTKSNQKDEERPLLVNGEDILDEILADNNLSDSLEKEKFEELFNDLVVEDKNVQENVAFKINEVIQDEELMLNDNKKIVNIPLSDEEIEVNNVKVEDSGVVPKVKDGGLGLLGVVCVPKVQRFSELLSNLCSPCEADLLFEDILVENGIDGGGDIRKTVPECTPPCRRAQAQPSRITSTPNRAPIAAASDVGE